MCGYKRRFKKTTLLVFGEGSDDEAFLRHIRRLFAKNKSGITIRNGGGGSPLCVLETMRKSIGFSEYDNKYVLVDGDVGGIEELCEQAQKLGVNVIVSEKCLEVEILTILGVTKSVRKRITTKSSCAKEILATKMDFSDESLARHLPKYLLVTARKKSKWLDSIIEIFEQVA